jgi:DNA-directed RNA polymerase specialized sigma24 family protein
MTPVAYDDLLRIARRHSRRAAEAEDLLQDALLDAVAAGRADLGDVANRRWLAGVIRNRATFAARTAARRGSRESRWAAEQDYPPDVTPLGPGEVVRDLPPSLKAVAALALTGHSRREILYLLRLTDTALRQRLSALKRHLAARGVEMPAATPGLTLNLAYGRIRDALLPKLVKEGGLFASHDPDGHLFIIRRSQTG